MTKLTTAAKYHQCSACLQLIVPGELYAAQRWAPWECHPDGDKMWFSQPACRWCADQYWKTTHPQDGWWEEAAQEWASDQVHRWMREVGEDYLKPATTWLPAYLARDEYREPLRVASRQASAFMAFLRRFAKGARPATIRRVGPALLACGFQRGPEGSLDHLLSCGALCADDPDTDQEAPKP